MRDRGRIWGVNERKGGTWMVGKKRKEKKKKRKKKREKKCGTWMVRKKEKKERGTGTEGERGKKLRKEDILGVVKKK
jgi:hypothetical protein